MEPFRSDLEIFEGPVEHDWPLWMVYDPAKDRYSRITQSDVMMIRYWALGDPKSIAERMSSETSCRVSEEDVLSFYRFARQAQFLVVGSQDATASLAKQAHKGSFLSWVIHHYLFFRIPLGNPDAFLTRSVSVLRGFVSRVTLCVLAVFFLVTLACIAATWSDYAQGFHAFRTPSGIFLALCAVGFAKTLHEFGHGFAAKYFGCRVPSWGMAFLVLAPVLWTDTTEVWRLTRRRDRLWVDASGMIAELILALCATVLWLIVPDGAIRTGLFVLSSTTWVLTLAVNLSPLMRFDGYHLLADGLGLPNLMTRSFAYARWMLRRVLCGVRQDSPERVSTFQAVSMLCYAPFTAIYRVGLFLGIALVVYHAVFRSLGLVLMGIEIGTFILMPILRELAVWFSLAKEGKMGRRFWYLGGVVAVSLIATALPLGVRGIAPAVLEPDHRFDVSMPAGVLQKTLMAGSYVQKDTVIESVFDVVGHYETIEARHALQEALLDQQAYQDGGVQNDPLGVQTRVLEARAALEEKEAHESLQVLHAPFSGFLVDVSDDARSGTSVESHHHIASLMSSRDHVVSYISAYDAQSLKIGQSVHFVSSNGRLSSDGQIVSIDAGSVMRLDPSGFGSPYGGDIAAHKDRDVMHPDKAVLRVVAFFPLSSPLSLGPVWGHIVFHEEGRSLLGRWYNHAASFVIQEANF